MLKLHYSPGACSLASHIALEEAGADYELHAVSLRAGEQRRPEFLAINPIGQTPALETDEGVLTQNLAIMAYVAAAHPDAGLIDNTSSFAFGRMQAFNAFLGASVHPAIGKVVFSYPPMEGEAKAEATEVALAKFDLIENSLFQGPWVTGPAYSVADGYLSVFTRWARQAGLLDLVRFPRLNDHLDRIQARPAVQRALAAEGIQAV